MNLVESALLASSAVAAVGAVGAALSTGWLRRWAAGGAVALCGVGGVVAGLALLHGRTLTLKVPGLLPLGSVEFAGDALSGLFAVLIGAVAAVVGVYSIGYTAGHHSGPGEGAGSRTTQAILPLFVLAMVWVPLAGNVTTFLVLWELMALTSLVLVLAEHRARAEVRTAGAWYAAMTHGGFLAILLALLLFVSRAGDESFTALRAAAGGIPPGVRAVIFILVLIGFGSKAGAVPLHVWLPRAHPEAPSHVSALMSAAMVKLGLYGLLRVGFDLLGGGPQWWWTVVLIVGAGSALYGVLQASVAVDLKRLLGYSTTENLGMILMAVGAAGIFAAQGNRTLASVLLAAALLHAVNHAGFKTLLFLGAGSVLRATGLRDLDRMGGLVSRMPFTAALFGVGALAAAALPPGNGFVSEWLLLQGLIHSLTSAPNVLIAVAMPLAVGVVALTAGLGVATFVKAFGVGFLARPRSEPAARATESSLSMIFAMALTATGCAGLAIAPAAVGPYLNRVVTAFPAVSDRAPLQAGVTLRLAGIAGSMSPLLIAVGLLAGSAVIVTAARLFGRPRRRSLAWGCGGTRLDPRMEYTATSFAEPLTRVFDDVLRPESDVDVTHHDESAYLIESVRYRQRVADRVETALYPPVLNAAERWGRIMGRLHNGSVHRYLAVGLVGLITVLVVVGVTS
ncbi:proton-conducting transporter membrane subunit [Kribbella sp. GL6]|uniref:proton-conducting transporter transmembrane domain-containing protein n=1 Tax=Kribbella sp. GL6 TaxID=3419765 RepID=UPI003D00E3F5